MATYGTKYYSIFNDISGNTFQINLKLKNYSSTSYQIKAFAENPLSLSYKGGRDEIDNSIHGSELTFDFYVTGTSNNYSDILESNYQDWQILVTKNSNTWWQGWLQPENLSSRDVAIAYVISLSAVDGLANLQNIDYPYLPTYQTWTGATSMLLLIKNCLNQTGIALPIKSQMNIYTPPLSATTTLDHVLTNEKRFIQFDSGKATFFNCYDALSAMLNSFNAHLIQSNGAYVITQKNEVNSKQVTYDWNTLTPTIASYNRQLNIDPKIAMDSDDLSKVRPTKAIDLTYHNLDAGRFVPDYVINGFFNYNSSGWISDDFPYDFTSVGWDSTTKRLSAYQSFPTYADQHSAAILGNTFNLDSNSGSTITISVSSTLTYISFGDTVFSSLSYPTLRIQLLDYTHGNVVVGSVDRPFPIQSGTSVTYVENLSFKQTGSHYIKLWIIPSSTYMDGCIVEFDNVTIFKNNDTKLAFDVLYEGSVNGSTAIDVATVDQYFGDGSTVYQVGTLMYAPSALTTTWYNYNERSQFLNYDFSAQSLKSTFPSSLSPFDQFYPSVGGKYWNWISTGLIRAGNAFDGSLTNLLFGSSSLGWSPGNYAIQLKGSNNSTGTDGFQDFLTFDFYPTNNTDVYAKPPAGFLELSSTGSFDQIGYFPLSAATNYLGFNTNVFLTDAIQVDLNKVLLLSGSTITGWQNIDDLGGGQWFYSGSTSSNYAACVAPDHSDYLMQGNFPAGTYTIQFACNNLSSTSTNFYIASQSIATGAFNGNLYSFSISASSSFNTYTGIVTLSELSNLGFHAVRTGLGKVNMAVKSFKITSSTLPTYNLQQLNVYNKLRRANKFRNYLRITIQDGTNIQFNNILKLNNKLYEIVAMTSNPQFGWLELDLVEYLQNNIATTITTTQLTSSS